MLVIFDSSEVQSSFLCAQHGRPQGEYAQSIFVISSLGN